MSNSNPLYPFEIEAQAECDESMTANFCNAVRAYAQQTMSLDRGFQLLRLDQKTHQFDDQSDKSP